MLKVVVLSFIMFLIYDNLKVSCYRNCYNDIFVHNTAEDDMAFESGLLLEVVVSHRAECVSLPHLQDECNLISYNPSSSLCRLHHFYHANQTGTGIMAPGWINYARRCPGQPNEPDCNVTDSSILDPCQFCFHDNVWKHDDMCIFFKTIFTNTSESESVILELDFDLEAGMVVVVKGPVYGDENWLAVSLEDTDDHNTYLCMELSLVGGLCDAYDENNDDICDDVMPQVDLQNITLTFRLTNSNIKIFINGKFIIQYENLLRKNRIDIYGFADGAQVLIVKTPESCN